MSPAKKMLQAVKNGDAQRVKDLLAVDPALANVKGVYDKTPLHCAVEKNDTEVVAILLAAGAEIEAETSWGSTPLSWAANDSNIAAGELLLARGAKASMWIMAGLGMLDRVAEYFESPAPIQPDSGWRRCREETAPGVWTKTLPSESYPELVSDAFYVASRNGHIPVMAFLLKRGANIDYPGFFGGTALHWAAINGHKAAVEFLLDHGADTTLKDSEFNCTPHGWAKEGGHAEIMELLEKK